jgi:cellulose synthase operon protein C
MEEDGTIYEVGQVGAGATVLQGENINNIVIINNVTPNNLFTPEQLQQFREIVAPLQSDATKLLAFVSEKGEPGDPLELKINEAIRLVEDGSLRAALKAYERLWKNEASGASPHNRYRLQANMALIHLMLDDRAAAIQGFRNAYDENPKSPSARATLATALLLENERAQSFDLALSVLAEDQTVRQAACVILDAAPNDLSAPDVESLIPDGLRDLLEVLLGLSMRASQDKDHIGAVQYANTAVSKYPDDWRSLSTLGIALLAPITEIAGLQFTRLIPESLQSTLNKSIDLFRRAWNLLLSREDTIRGAYVAANLVSTLDVAGYANESAIVLDKALSIAPNDTALLRQYIRRMAINGDWSSVLNAVRKIREDDYEPADTLIYLQALIQTGYAAIALEEAKQFQLSCTDERLVEMAGATRLEAASKLTLLTNEIDDVLAISPTSIVLRSIAITLLPEGDRLADKLAKETELLIAGINDPRDRFHAADALYRVKEYSKAADLYAGLHSLSQPHDALYRRLTALYFSDRRSDARILFESLDNDVRALQDYARIGVAVYERSGLLAEAREILDRILQEDENLKDRLHWIYLSERMGQPQPVANWLATVSSEQQGDPRDLMVLAQAIDRHSDGQKSLKIAYRALRNGYGDPQIHLAYAISLFIMGKVRPEFTLSPDVVASDTVVILKENGSERIITRILETEPSPKIERDEISPSDSFAQKLIGLKLGDEIEIPNLPIGIKTYTIAEIKSKFLFAHFRTLQTFETMFPESQAFGSFSVDQSKGQDQLKPIFDSAKERHNFGQHVLDTYKSGTIPLAFIAKFSGASPFDMWDSIRYEPDGQFNVAQGLAAEFSNANELLASNRSGIIDPITLYGVINLGIASVVKDAFEDLAVVQTTIDLFREHLEAQRAKRGRRGGYFGWDGTHFRMIELSEDGIEQLVTRAQTALNFVESLTLIPAETTVEMNSTARAVIEDLHPAFMDTIYAAQSSGRLLVCDDFPLRMLVAEVAGVASVWTQPINNFALNRNLITLEAWFKTTGELVDAGYFFTMVGHKDFLFDLHQNDWAISSRVKKFCQLMARPSSDQASVRKVLAELISFGWSEAPSGEANVRFFAHLFGAFSILHPKGSVVTIAQEAIDLTERNLRASGRAKFLKKRLLGSTTLKSVSAIASSIDAIAVRISTKMANAISQSLERLENL